GHEVTIYDNLSEQVHGSKVPDYLCPDLNLISGDVRDLPSLTKAVRGADVIFHLAAAVGVGQSMYQISSYTEINSLGTANLLQAILDSGARPEKIVVASSMSIYGEGSYDCQQCGIVNPSPRPVEQLRHKQWETLCPQCGEVLKPVSTQEDKPLQCTSIYALSKKDQEEMTLLFGRTYGIPAVALRYFNIYGPRQALSNPYTGVAAIFASRFMNGKSPVIFEDGLQLRDFVNVRDIVQANLLAMESSGGDGMALNVGSGEPVSVRQVSMKRPVPSRSVLIFGGAGFIGSNWAHRLLTSTDADVHVFDNLSRPKVGHNLRWLQKAANGTGRLRVTIADIRDTQKVKRAVVS